MNPGFLSLRLRATPNWALYYCRTPSEWGHTVVYFLVQDRGHWLSGSGACVNGVRAMVIAKAFSCLCTVAPLSGLLRTAASLFSWLLLNIYIYIYWWVVMRLRVMPFCRHCRFFIYVVGSELKKHWNRNSPRVQVIWSDSQCDSQEDTFRATLDISL